MKHCEHSTISITSAGLFHRRQRHCGITQNDQRLPIHGHQLAVKREIAHARLIVVDAADRILPGGIKASRFLVYFLQSPADWIALIPLINLSYNAAQRTWVSTCLLAGSRSVQSNVGSTCPIKARSGFSAPSSARGSGATVAPAAA